MRFAGGRSSGTSYARRMRRARVPPLRMRARRAVAVSVRIAPDPPSTVRLLDAGKANADAKMRGFTDGRRGCTIAGIE
jgi:hypothetical protein